jgi:hypothetical protein
MCQLHPLSNREIAAFIEQGLASNNHPATLFDERAVKRVALYAQGNPRSVTALCDRAIQLVGTTSSITPELIEGAAGDLDLHASAVDYSRGERQASDQDHSADFQFRPADFTDVAGPSFPPPYLAEMHNAVGSRRRAHWPRTVMIAAILAACAAMIRTEIALTVPSDWSARLKQFAQLPAPSRPVQAKNETSVETRIKEEPPIRVPGPDYPAAMPQDNGSNKDTDLTTEKLANDTETLNGAAVENVPPKLPARVGPDSDPSENKERRTSSKMRSDPKSENLQSQITKAIESRAIMGVEVSVMHGTAYLDGRVASERQRRAAERAARSVAGVERVQNRIAIKYG